MLPRDQDGLAGERLSFRAIPLVTVKEGQVVQAPGKVGVFLAQDLAPNF